MLILEDMLDKQKYASHLHATKEQKRNKEKQ